MQVVTTVCLETQCLYTKHGNDVAEILLSKLTLLVPEYGAGLQSDKPSSLVPVLLHARDRHAAPMLLNAFSHGQRPLDHAQHATKRF